MKKLAGDIMLYIVAIIVFIIVVPFMLLYNTIMILVAIPKYGIRMAFLKQANWEKFYEELKIEAINSGITDPVIRAKMPRLKFDTDYEYEFSTCANMNPRELVYVANEEDKVLENMLANNIEYFNRWAKKLGMRIVYLPSLYKDLVNKEVCEYRAPANKHPLEDGCPIGNDYLLQYLIHPEDREIMKSGFLWTQHVIRDDYYDETYSWYFLPLSSYSELTIEQQLADIKKTILYTAFWLKPHLNCTVRDKEYNDEDDFADNHFNSQHTSFQEIYENIDDLMDEIKERIQILRKRGVAQHILEQLIKPDDKPSRMIITKDNSIILPDYNNIEIKMEPLVKAVYLLFLNHPEGILFKHLPDYREELTKIYIKLKPYGMSDKVMQSIEDVTNPLLNSINEKCARIRGAFVGQFDNHLARHYYIDGLRGEAKKIALPRDLVVWE